MLCGKAGFAPVEGDVALACLVVKGGRREAGGLGPGRRQASQGSRGAATPLCCQRRPGSDQVPYTLAGTDFWPEQPERRGHLGLTDPVGAPGAGPRLNYVWQMAIVVLLLFVLTGLLLVAEDDLADGDGCERAAPRAVGGVVPRRVLARVAREVTEVVGLPARLENGVLVGGPGGAKGGVCSEHAFSGISWTALMLEVGKSPTEVTRAAQLPVSLPSAISEFASSSSPS